MWLFSEPHVDVPFKLVVLPSIPLESVSSTEFVGKKWPNKNRMNFTDFGKHSRQLDFKQQQSIAFDWHVNMIFFSH